jgi:hypothetical protein
LGGWSSDFELGLISLPLYPEDQVLAPAVFANECTKENKAEKKILLPVQQAFPVAGVLRGYRRCDGKNRYSCRICSTPAASREGEHKNSTSDYLCSEKNFMQFPFTWVVHGSRPEAAA